MAAEDGAASGEEVRFKASDLLKAAGLTYRQLHVWETQAGIAPSERATEEGWRRFTGEEVLALCVCSSLRRQFSVPLKQIGQLYLWLVGRRHDSVGSLLVEIADATLRNMHENEKIVSLLALRGEALAEAMKEPANAYIVREFIRHKLNMLATQPSLLAVRLAGLGLPVYLCTTFDNSMILQETNLVRVIAQRAAHGPTIIFPLNDLINEWKASVKLPAVGLDAMLPSFIESWRKLHEQAEVSISEREVLRLIRERAYQRVTVHVEGGQIVQMDVHEDIQLGPGTVREDAIIQLIKGKAYQTVEIVVRDGHVAVLHRKSTKKVTSDHGKNPNR